MTPLRRCRPGEVKGLWQSIDEGSAASYAPNTFAPNSAAGSNRGASDFDIRNTFTAAVTYDIPATHANAVLSQITRDWSIENVVLARSAQPVDVLDGVYRFSYLDGFNASVHPDLVPGAAMYLYGSQYPGGKAINSAAFVHPPIHPTTQQPVRNGNVPRNFFRGFGVVQWDLAIHRVFPIRDRVALQFRAEMFNILNHPIFGHLRTFMEWVVSASRIKFLRKR